MGCPPERISRQRGQASVDDAERGPDRAAPRVADGRHHARLCGVFDGSLPRRDWEAMFSLEGCRITGDELRIVIESEVTRPMNDPRELGVALRYIVLDPM